ncbi:MAG TPA: hypothetical protein DCP92_05620 [Nitrospiraceae bacterium]|nr:hypothetical protein [Nitrospiraceae bacterium]
MQDMVGKALEYEEHRLMNIVRNHLQDSDKEALELLLEDPSGMYELTQLKHEPKDFSAGEIKREILRGERVLDLYLLAQRVLPDLKISNESIKYYASLVTYYSVFRLKRLDISIVRLYLLCFVHYRYQKIHDNLLNSLIYHVRQYVDESKAASKERVYSYHTEGNQNLNKAGEVLRLFTDDSIPENTPFGEVRLKLSVFWNVRSWILWQAILARTADLTKPLFNGSTSIN